MAIALRQNKHGSSFSSNTSAGSLLVCVVVGEITSTTGSGLTINTPTTSGFTWTQAESASYANTQGVSPHFTFINGQVSIFYIANASSMPSATTTSVSVTGGGGTPSVDMRLYEFTGVASSSPVDTVGQQANSTTTSSTVTAGSISTTAGDLIFVSTTITPGSGDQGSGYTFGVVNGDQYNLSGAGGSTNTAFVVSAALWGTAAVAFKSGSSSASPSGVSAAFSVGTPSTTASGSSSPSGVSAAFIIGTALPGGAVAFAEPAGVSIRSALGEVSAGIPVNYGNVVSGSSGLPTGINTTYFYARWTGWLMVDTPGMYTVGLNVADGGDLYIGTQPIVNTLGASQSAHSSTAYTQASTIDLAANIAYPLVIEWQHGGGANYECQLLWTPPGGATEVIPTANLSLAGKWWNGTSSLWYPNTWY